jgi:hypothetical protein
MQVYLALKPLILLQAIDSFWDEAGSEVSPTVQLQVWRNRAAVLKLIKRGTLEH